MTSVETLFVPSVVEKVTGVRSVADDKSDDVGMHTHVVPTHR